MPSPRHPARWARLATGALLLLGVPLALGACSSKPGTGSAASPSTSASPAPSAAQTVNVVPDPATIGAFNPASVTIHAGQTVKWVFQDANPHTVTADDNSYTSSQSGLANGATYEHTFTTPGTYAYHCFIHPQMHGTVVVQ